MLRSPIEQKLRDLEETLAERRWAFAQRVIELVGIVCMAFATFGILFCIWQQEQRSDALFERIENLESRCIELEALYVELDSRQTLVEASR